jgi:hypothetical protein
MQAPLNRNRRNPMIQGQVAKLSLSLALFALSAGNDLLNIHLQKYQFRD